MLLPDETYEARSANVLIADVDEIEAAKALAALRRCDEFLKRHGIRPEFFCRHRERLALQAWLLKKSKLYSGECFGRQLLRRLSFAEWRALEYAIRSNNR